VSSTDWRFDVAAIGRMVDELRDKEHLDWNQVRIRSGVSLTVLHKVHNGATVSSDTIAKLFKYLGVEDVRPFIVRSGRNRSNGG
jgi:hypothetical protein